MPDSDKVQKILRRSALSKLIRILSWSLAGLVVLLVLILGVTSVAMPGCGFCHQSGAFAEQSHANAHAKYPCTTCHAQPGAPGRVVFAYHVVFGMVLRIAPEGGPAAGIPNGTCLSCHANVQQKIVQAQGISIQHSTCAKGRLCTDCHSDAAHGSAIRWQTVYNMNVCLDCHSADAARSDCTTCHAAKSTTEIEATGEWQVTHGPNWKQTHGMGQLQTCAGCHPNDFCARCHGISLPHNADFIKQHPTFALSNRASCAVCHQQSFCDRCHGLPMPHPVGFTPTHPDLVKKLGTSVCMKCHIQDDCNNCHLRHVHPGGAIKPPTIGGAK
jgi:hypothetical protein